MGSATIYHIRFFDPATDKTDYYFSSLSAIYDVFEPEVVGVALQSIYQQKLKFGEEYQTKFCVIKKDIIIRKPKANV